MSTNTIYAFILTTLAGLSTVLGACLIFWIKTTCTKFLSFGLGLSAGVMIYLSFFELLKESNHLLASTGNNNWLVIMLFLVGLAIAGIIDIFTNYKQPYTKTFWNKQALLKTGIFTAIVITIHNFPEGIATFTTASVNIVFGLSIAIAIAIHNIPEGFCVALPIYYATHNKQKSIFYALLAGLAEPLGALLTYLVLSPYINAYLLGVMLAVVAGIMVYISFAELIPTARKYSQHLSLFGLVSGLILMAFELNLLDAISLID
ncbi:MAG: zinc transporter ZupT [Patescibacteria group bacterium]|jgi:ZIP family zinc transporter